MKKAITIKDGTSIEQLTKAIKKHEEDMNTTILTFFVASNHRCTFVEYDGISVTKWIGEIEDYLEFCDYRKMELIGSL